MLVFFIKGLYFLNYLYQMVQFMGYQYLQYPLQKMKEKKLNNIANKIKKQTSEQPIPFKKKSNTNLSTVASYAAFTTTSFSRVIKNSKHNLFQSHINRSHSNNRKPKSNNKSSNIANRPFKNKKKGTNTKSNDEKKPLQTNHKPLQQIKKHRMMKSQNNLSQMKKQNKSVSKANKKKVKKKIEKSQQEQTTAIEKVKELTDRKKTHMDFFIYKNREIPIENTEQRKFVLKIKFIDERALSYRDSNNSQEIINTIKGTINQKSKIIDQTMTVEKAIETEEKKLQERDCQTDSQLIESEKCFTKETKCLIQVLSELEFLYLPDESNFEGFTTEQKDHYKELLMFMAKKFEYDFETDNKEDQDSKIEMMLEDRILKQRGQIASYMQNGIPTHVPSIISYLSNLFCFLEINEKRSLIARLNSSYGYSLLQKLSLFRKKQTTSRHCRLISESSFWSFEEELHEGLEFEDEATQQYLHYHNRAIFDCVNEFIEQFQPYYPSNGEPFPWSYNLETTFYCIDDDSFSALSTQIKEKVWDCCQKLSGIIIETPGQSDKGQSIKHKSHINKILSHEQKMINQEIKKSSDKIELDEQRTMLLLTISDELTNRLLFQFMSEFGKFSNLQICQ